MAGNRVDRITILREYGEKKILMEFAKENGYTTLTDFINEAIDEKVRRIQAGEQTQEQAEEERTRRIIVEELMKRGIIKERRKGS